MQKFKKLKSKPERQCDKEIFSGSVRTSFCFGDVFFSFTDDSFNYCTIDDEGVVWQTIFWLKNFSAELRIMTCVLKFCEGFTIWILLLVCKIQKYQKTNDQQN
jgi:hypothetical protein